MNEELKTAIVESTEPSVESAPEPLEVSTAKKVFTRNDVKKFVEVKVYLPKLYPDYEPWTFKLRLRLSKEAEERRQEMLALSATEATARASEQALDEVCDLLIELPSGFGDLKDTGQGPGHSWKSYVETAPDESSKQLLFAITEGADSLYWASISPREFR